MKIKTCCFTGHRKLSEKRISHIITRLDEEIERLIQEGVTDFISNVNRLRKRISNVTA